MKLLIDKSPATLSELIKEDLVLGQLITPLTSYSDAGLPYGIDNGAFTRFNKKEFTRILTRQEKAIDRCLFVAIPDIVGNARQRLGGSWELFIPGMKVGDIYKYEIRNQTGHCYQKSDPYGFRHEVRPNTGSIVAELGSYNWSDGDWLDQRDNRNPIEQPISVYEIHLGSWMHGSIDSPFIDFKSCSANFSG